MTALIIALILAVIGCLTLYWIICCQAKAIADLHATLDAYGQHKVAQDSYIATLQRGIKVRDDLIRDYIATQPRVNRMGAVWRLREVSRN